MRNRDTTLLSMLAGSVLLAAPVLIAAESKDTSSSDIHAEPEIVSAGEVEPDMTSRGQEEPDLVSHGDRIPHLTTEADQKPAGTQPRGMLRYAWRGVFLPEPVTSAPLVFGSSPGDGGLSVRQRQELDVLATWAKERPGTQIRIIAVATSDEPSSFAPVNAKVAAIIERLRDAKIAADRIASVTRVPYPDEDPLAPGAVAVGLVRPETPQRGAGAH